MTSECLLDAIGQLDDDLILEAAAPTRRVIPWGKVAGWAAAIAVCVGIARLPGLLPLNGAGSAAAPESDRFLGDVMLDLDTTDNDYEYRCEQESQVEEPSAANKVESSTADGAAQGVMEPRFFTQRGVYLLIAPPAQAKLPDTNLTELGKLVSAVPGTKAYPATGTQELVGCPVWESEDGEYLYVQLSDGTWLTAKLYQ